MTMKTTVRKCDDFANWGLYYVTHNDKEYTVHSPNSPYVGVMLHAERKAPAGSTYPSGKPRLTDSYTRRVRPTSPLGQTLITAVKQFGGFA